MLVMLLLMGCATMLPAQTPATTSISAPSNIPVPVYIYVGSSQEAATWYLEENSISNEFGERVVELKNTSKASFFALLEEIGRENHFTAFSADPQNNTLRLSKGNHDAQAVLAELVTQLSR